MFCKKDRIDSYIFLDFSPTRKGWSTNKIKIYLLMDMGAQGAIRNFKIPSALGGGMQKRAASPASIGLPSVPPWRCSLKPRHCKLVTPNWIWKQEVSLFFVIFTNSACVRNLAAEFSNVRSCTKRLLFPKYYILMNYVIKSSAIQK